MRAILLGTSAASPVPRPGCACPQCAEARRDGDLRRSRTALRIENGDEIALFDPGPDVLAQLERHALSARADLVLVSHTHHDHVLGLPDLVWQQPEGALPLVVHTAPEHRERIQAAFPDLVRKGKEKITFSDWGPGTRLRRGDMVLEGFETGHRQTFPTTGLLIRVTRNGKERKIAYATDMGELPSVSRAMLERVDLFVADGTYLGKAGYGHPGTDDVLRLAQSLRVRRVALTHIGHWQVTEGEARKRLGQDVLILRDGDDLLAV